MRIEEKKSLGEGILSLPNAMALHQNSLYVCDARNHIYRFNDGKSIVLMQGEGYGRYTFRQPVAIEIIHGCLVVADWHNHRLVYYEMGGNYIGETGFFSPLGTSFRGRAMLRAIAKIKGGHSYLLYHSGDKKIEMESNPLKHRIMRTLNFLFRRKIVGSNLPINKPNGLACIGDYFVFTQKNNRCLTALQIGDDFPLSQKLFKNITSFKNKAFGRLGNISVVDNHFHICDETYNCIWIIDNKLRPVHQLKMQLAIRPFSCCQISHTFLAIGGVDGFAIYNRSKGECVYENLSCGEIHDVVYNDAREILYICNRSVGKINQFKIIL